MGPVAARPRPSSLRTLKKKGPLRCGRCGDWRRATHLRHELYAIADLVLLLEIAELEAEIPDAVSGPTEEFLKIRLLSVH